MARDDGEHNANDCSPRGSAPEDRRNDHADSPEHTESGKDARAHTNRALSHISRDVQVIRRLSQDSSSSDQTATMSRERSRRHLFVPIVTRNLQLPLSRTWS